MILNFNIKAKPNDFEEEKKEQKHNIESKRDVRLTNG